MQKLQSSLGISRGQFLNNNKNNKKVLQKRVHGKHACVTLCGSWPGFSKKAEPESVKRVFHRSNLYLGLLRRLSASSIIVSLSLNQMDDIEFLIALAVGRG